MRFASARNMPANARTTWHRTCICNMYANGSPNGNRGFGMSFALARIMPRCCYGLFNTFTVRLICTVLFTVRMHSGTVNAYAQNVPYCAAQYLHGLAWRSAHSSNYCAVFCAVLRFTLALDILLLCEKDAQKVLPSALCVVIFYPCTVFIGNGTTPARTVRRDERP